MEKVRPRSGETWMWVVTERAAGVGVLLSGSEEAL